MSELSELISFSDWDALVAEGRSLGDAEALPAVAPLDPVQIQYTSGTTGFPKGALLHHLGVVNASAMAGHRARIVDGSVFVNAMPMYHIGGGSVTELGTMAAMGNYPLMPDFDPGLLLELIETYGGTHTLVVPTMLLATLDHPNRPSTDLSSLRVVMSGASTVPAALVSRTKETFGCDLVISFGQTELHGIITQTEVTDSAEDQADTIGRPMPQVEVRISDPDTGAVLPVGEQGEICARGYQTMIEYFALPEATAATIDADGWLHTGDLGSIDERGYVRIAGRLKDMIIRGGLNIYPREIEEVLFAHSAVVGAAVVGVADDQWGERVVAVLRPADPANPPDPVELGEYCRERIAAFKAPSSWYSVSEFPLTPSGKVQKFVLRDQIAAGLLQSLDENGS